MISLELRLKAIGICKGIITTYKLLTERDVS